jgi:hypothetical protein
VTYYLPEPIYQLDGSPCQGSNCWAAVGAWQMDGQSGGDQTPSPTRFRHMAGEHECGGGSIYDIQRGFLRQGRSYSVRDLPYQTVRSWMAVEDRRLLAIATAYNVWPEDKKCDSPGFDGFHMVGVVPGLLRYGNLRIMNPLCSVPGDSREARYQKVKLDDVMDAARACAKATGQPAGTIRVGIVWRPRPDGDPAPAPPTTEELLAQRVAELEQAIIDIRNVCDDVTY